MRILIIADGRSPITRTWVGDLISSGHEVVLISTFPFSEIHGVRQSYTLPICFAKYAGNQMQGGQSVSNGDPEPGLKKLIRRYRGLFQQARYWLGPLTFLQYRQQLKAILARESFDVVHVLRIPFEGMFAVPALAGQKVIVSIWGNDLTLHASKNLYMRKATRRVLERADGLIVDVERDVALARDWGYSREKPVMVALTSGGIDMDRLQSAAKTHTLAGFELPQGKLVINPRGIRPGYIRNDTFFAAIPRVLEAIDEPVYFLCPSMAGQPEAEHWVRQYGIEDNVLLLPFLSQEDLWYCFSRAQVMVSPSTHDGTPNSLLESMTLGAFPVVGDIVSLREWIVDGVNGLLAEPGSVADLSTAIIRALTDQTLREEAKKINQALVAERASLEIVRQQRDEFYNQIRNQPIA